MLVFRRLIVVLFLVTTLSWNNGNAQSGELAAQETKVALLYSKLFESLHADWDTTMAYSEKFSNQFTSFITGNPATLIYPFKKLIDSNYLRIGTSSDGNFRIYSWDTWTGGTMHRFSTIYQWRDNGKVFTKVSNDDHDNPGSFVSQIFTVVIDGKSHYLVVTNATYSTKDARQSIAAFTINNSKLVDTVRIFKTKTRRLNRIDVDFDFFSVVGRPERPLELITFDNKQKMIFIPVVDDEGQVTSRNVLYQLKGGYFEFIGIDAGK